MFFTLDSVFMVFAFQGKQKKGTGKWISTYLHPLVCFLRYCLSWPTLAVNPFCVFSLFSLYSERFILDSVISLVGFGMETPLEKGRQFSDAITGDAHYPLWN